MSRITVQHKWILALLLLISGVASAEEASLQWAKVTTLSTVTSGVVAELKVQAGQRVKKGQTLLLMQQDVFSSRLRAAESLARRNQDLFKEATAEFRRATEMYDNSMLSDHDLEIKRLALLMAEAEHKQAQAKLAVARFQQQQSVITAPFDAIVTDVLVAEHETINGKQQSAPLLQLVSGDSMSVVAELDLASAMKLTAGKKLTVKLAGKRFDAVIHRIRLTQAMNGTAASVQKASIELLVPVTPNSKNYPGLPVSIDLP